MANYQKNQCSGGFVVNVKGENMKKRENVNHVTCLPNDVKRIVIVCALIAVMPIFSSDNVVVTQTKKDIDGGSIPNYFEIATKKEKETVKKEKVEYKKNALTPAQVEALYKLLEYRHKKTETEEENTVRACIRCGNTGITGAGIYKSHCFDCKGTGYVRGKMKSGIFD